jgi:hypothetical protein
MSQATKAERKRAEKTRRNDRRQRRRATARKRAKRRNRKHGREAEPALTSWPDTTGLSDEEAARVWGEFFFWEDYHDRNPDSTFGAPM